MADADEWAGLPERFGTTPVDGLASPELARWTTDQKVELALGVVERAARGVGRGHAGGGRACTRTPRRAGGARQLARVRRLLQRHSGLGLCVRVRGRGRGPDDRPRRGNGPRPGGARPGGDRGSRRPSGRSRWWARVSRRAVAARWSWTRSWPPRSWRSSAGCCPPTPSSADAPCSPAARARTWPTRRSRSWTTGPTRRGRPARRSTGRGSATRRTPLVEGGRLLTFLFDVRTARRAERETTASAARGSYRSPPSVGTSNLIVGAGRRRPSQKLLGDAGDGLLRDRRRRPPLRRQSSVRNLLRRGLRTAHRERPAGRARTGADHREPSRLHAPRSPRRGVRVTLDTPRRERQDPPRCS